MSKTRIIIGLLLIVTLAGANAWQYWLKPDPLAPAITLNTINNERISLKGLQGKPVLVSFWATSCGLCLAEIDDLITLHNRYQQQGYTTLAVALSYDSLPRIKQLSQQRKLPYKVIYDEKGEYANAFGGVRMTPTHFLINPDGRIIWQNVGPVELEALDKLIKPLLG